MDTYDYNVEDFDSRYQADRGVHGRFYIQPCEDRRASASYLQRRLKIGYNRAARIMERLEAEGRVGPPDGPRGRQFLG